MVIFSDLDRSIIYSNKFLDGIETNEYECIEVKDEKEISYISLKSIETLKRINENALFIPTTTRTAEQFNRIDFKRYGIDFKYAITSNGGRIFKEGLPLESWRREVEKIKLESTPIEVMVNRFEEYSQIDGITNFRIAEELFFYIVVDFSKFHIDKIENYLEKLEENKWAYYISGRKIYFLPMNLTKENAINHICNIENIEEFSTIGDSNMDLGMLNTTDNAYVLKHGDIDLSSIQGRFILSEEVGLKGTEEILEKLHKELLLNNATVI